MDVGKNAIQIKKEMTSSFLGGLNVFQDETLIKNNELTDARNVLLEIDGLRVRDGLEKVLQVSGDRILGLDVYKKEDGTQEIIFMPQGSDGGDHRLRKYVNGTVTTIGSKQFNDTALMNFVQADNKLFIFNGVDNLCYYDGSTIHEYTEIPTPQNLTVHAVGTTGSEEYCYRVTAFNDSGETLATTTVCINNGNEELNASNYNELTWDAVSGAKGYNIYGRKGGGLGPTFMETVYTNSYKDKKQVKDPSISILPPEENSTKGVIGKYPAYALSRVFVAGIKNHPSRMIFSAFGKYVTNFSTPVYGAGGLEIHKDDGAKIIGIKPFQKKVLVFKENGIYAFFFNDQGVQQLDQIVSDIGACSHRSITHVENDIVFAAKKDGRIAVYSLGNQENYVSTVLRTNELSIKISPLLEHVNQNELDRVSAVYFDNRYILSVPHGTNANINTRVYVMDSRFGAWTYWDGFNALSFAKYKERETGQGILLVASDASAKILKFNKNLRSDEGNPIYARIATKSFNQKDMLSFKRYLKPTVWIKNNSTNSKIDIYLYCDDQRKTTSINLPTPQSGTGGIGSYLAGVMLAGDSVNLTIGDQNSTSDVLIELYRQLRGKSLKYVFVSNTDKSFYRILGLGHDFKVLKRRLPTHNRFYMS